MPPLRKTFLTMVAFDQRDDGAAEPRLQPSGSLSPRDMKLRLISSEADRRSRQAHDVVSI